MSLNRYGKRRDTNEPEIIKELKAMGCTVETLDTPLDLLVGVDNLNLLVEVKTEHGRLTPKQKKFIQHWKGDFAIVRTPAEARDLINNLRGLNNVDTSD